MTTTTVNVVGMTCDHCANAVKGELGKLRGVSAVEVDLASGNVTIDSAELLPPADIAAAVDEAGFELG